MEPKSGCFIIHLNLSSLHLYLKGVSVGEKQTKKMDKKSKRRKIAETLETLEIDSARKTLIDYI